MNKVDLNKFVFADENTAAKLEVNRDNIDKIVDWSANEVRAWAEDRSFDANANEIRDLVREIFIFLAQKAGLQDIDVVSLIKVNEDYEDEIVKGSVSVFGKTIIDYHSEPNGSKFEVVVNEENIKLLLQMFL